MNGAPLSLAKAPLISKDSSFLASHESSFSELLLFYCLIANIVILYVTVLIVCVCVCVCVLPVIRPWPRSTRRRRASTTAVLLGWRATDPSWNRCKSINDEAAQQRLLFYLMHPPHSPPRSHTVPPLLTPVPGVCLKRCRRWRRWERRQRRRKTDTTSFTAWSRQGASAPDCASLISHTIISPAPARPLCEPIWALKNQWACPL